MLEQQFVRLIEEIHKVRNSHVGNPDEKALLSRNWEFIFSDFDGWLVLYCSSSGRPGGYWIYPMLHPRVKVEALKEQLPHFDIDMPSAAYGHVMSGGGKHWLEPFWGDSENSEDIEIPLFFYRQYYGNPSGEENYYEFNQLVTHPLDLHWSPKRNSYCRIDDYGDEVEKIKIIHHMDVKLILIRTKTIEKLLYLNNWVLVRYFDFNRFNSDNPAYDSCITKVVEPKEYEAKFEIRKCNREYIEFRGAEIFRPTTPKEELLSWSFDDEEILEKKYADFIVHDWKNGRLLKDYSINPANFANYFTKSDLPFETSTIFFKAEVLDKYKNNPDKYELDERSISCRGGWYLETYDINEHNQVHTYAVYLARLPHKEQLHWAIYNEEPKGAISKRAFQSDFKGEFSDDVPKLQMFQMALEKLGNTGAGKEILKIWSPKGGDWSIASKGLHYVKTENSNQWHDFIIALANTANEGFQVKPLRKIAASLGNTDDKLGTLGLIRFILEASGNGDKIPVVHGVLNDLQIRRGKGKAHGTWDTPEGSLIEDADRRLQDVICAIDELTLVVESLK